MSDTLSPHRTLFNAWLALLATITTANGYNTNIGTHVFSFRDTDKQPIEAAEIPCINATHTYVCEPQGLGCADCVMTIVVEAVPGSGADQTTAVQQASDDVERLVCRNPSNTLWFQAAYGGTPTAIDVTVADKNYGGAECKIEIQYSIKTQTV